MTIEAARARDGGKAYLGTHAKALGKRGVVSPDGPIGGWVLLKRPGSVRVRWGNTNKGSRMENQVTAVRGKSKSSILLPALGTGVENAMEWAVQKRRDPIRETGTPGAKDHSINKKIRPCRCYR